MVGWGLVLAVSSGHWGARTAIDATVVAGHAFKSNLVSVKFLSWLLTLFLFPFLRFFSLMFKNSFVARSLVASAN